MTEQRYASQCLYLQMTMGTKAGDGLVNLCRHIIRDGMRCVGPFLDDTETDCGLWEPNPKKARFLGEQR